MTVQNSRLQGNNIMAVNSILLLLMSWLISLSQGSQMSASVIQLTSSRAVNNEYKFAQLAENIARSNTKAKTEESGDYIVTSIVPFSKVGSTPSELELLNAAHTQLENAINGIGKELTQYGIDENSKISKISNNFISQDYRMGETLGKGACGELKLALREGGVPETAVAIKLEKYGPSWNGIRKPLNIEKKAKIYAKLAAEVGIPSVGPVGDYCEAKTPNIAASHAGMEMELLGSNLHDLLQICGRRLSIPTVLVIAIQMLQRLKGVHGENIMHRDIKPQNICIGRGLFPKSKQIFYLIDFGLAAEFTRDSAGYLIQTLELSERHGTALYMSRRCIKGLSQNPRDDLESLVNTLLALRGNLPYEHATTLREFDLEKNRLTPAELCEGMPDEFREFVEDVWRDTATNKRFEYDIYINKFRQSLAKLGHHEEEVEFDWESKYNMLYENPELKSVGVGYEKNEKRGW